MCSSVRVERRDERWVVLIEEPDASTSEQGFLIEEHARNYAAGQKIRLEQAEQPVAETS